jgi:hypothetical protein
MKGTKPYEKRDKKGRVQDIRTCKRAHGGDIKWRATAERRK